MIRRRFAGQIKEIAERDDYIKFTALQSGTFTLTIPAAVTTSFVTSVDYSLDGGHTWVTTNNSNADVTITTPTIAANDFVLWRGIAKSYTTGGQNHNTTTAVTQCSRFSGTANFNVSGDIKSMIYGIEYKSHTVLYSSNDANFAFMFYNCPYVKSIENLNLDVDYILTSTYQSMFQSCTGLTTCFSEITSNNIAMRGCAEMFQGCTSLVNAPKLSIASYGNQTFRNMFNGCTALVSVPSDMLPNTTLGGSCYFIMFQNCTNLVNAPILPATTLAAYCYYQMFYGCTKLKTITMLATDISADNCLTQWVKSVSSTGTFTKNSAMSSLPTGDSGIPSGWTVVNQ